jgi:hypothetical protein
VSERTPVYWQCGLRMRSEVELSLPVTSDESWDVDVRWGPAIEGTVDPPPGDVIAMHGSTENRWYTATSTERGYRMRFHDCGEFAVSADLTEVEIRPDPAGRTEILPILLAGTVSAFILALRGHTVLHASCVAIDGAALAFVGQSGRGKSTVAALMCVGGAQLVTDDVLTVAAGSPVTCVGGATELRLRAAASEIANAHPDATRSTADQRLALGLAAAPLGPLPLAGIVVPGPSRTATRVAVRRVDPTTGLFAVLGFPRVLGWTRSDVISRDFAVLSHVVNTVPVYDVRIPWGPPFDPRVAGELAALAIPPA